MTILLALLAGSAVFAAGYALGRRHQAEPLTLEKVRHAVDLRVAVHEAGHTVAAWHSPYVQSIDSVEMDEGTGRGNGRVLHRTVRSEAELVTARWYDVTVCLGGIAAEMVELRKTRSGNARDDLEKALAAARDVVEATRLDPPWEGDRPEADGFDPAKMYREVTDDEARVLRLGYARARAVILRDRERFNRVVHDLLEKGVLREAEVRSIFGRR